MSRSLISCRQLIDYIADYVGDGLDETQRSDFERHLAVCSSCRAYLETYRQTMALARGVRAEDDLAEGMPEELVQAILARVR